MNRSIKLILLFFFLGSACSCAGIVPSMPLQGVWKCDPYTLTGKGFATTATETSTFLMDGSYRGTSELIIRLESGRVVKTRDRSFGNWTLKDNIIKIHYDKVEFLSSDDPTYTVQMGQSNADAQQKKKNWSKSKILHLDDKLVTSPIESMYKGADVVVTCVRSR